MNILELYKNSSELLKNKGILTYKLDVKILLSFLLNIDTNELILYFNKDVDSCFVSKFDLLLNRRLNNEPIANIIGKKAFWDYEFFVNENVLTPRSDSEILIEAVLENFEDTEVVDVTSDNARMVIDGKIYEITFIDDPMQLHQHLEIFLRFIGGQNGGV